MADDFPQAENYAFFILLDYAETRQNEEDENEQCDCVEHVFEYHEEEKLLFVV